ncbi:protein kinase [uncultured Jatrophihabitans sp.]|uniref:protein kinase domain-containing protein n=1 Tax=uncultured Jatrophihabitans sp. TaxID=1610747 RepID=UPI0035C97E2F
MDGGEGTVVGGRYTLLRRLGRGGMAEVWLATDHRLGDKHVAVKRLLGYRADSPDSARDVERARREALAASRLNHGNLVAVTDFVAEDGEPFIVMEYVEGSTLSDLIAEQAMPVSRAARIIGQVASAVAAAHEAGIVHRDIKPANIMVTRRDVAKLADFGIARSAGDARLTQTGFFTGTVGYLAPELLDGSEASSASDVWALGAVLYETVEGRPAFQGDTTPTLIAAIVFRELPVPGHAPELGPLIARMLERDPARRIGIDEVTTELVSMAARTERPHDTALPEQPPARTTVRTAAPPAPASPFPAPPSGRSHSRRGWWIAAAVVLVLIAAGLVAVLTGGGSDSPGDGSPQAGAPVASSPSVAPTSPSASVGSSSTSPEPTDAGVTVLAHRGGRESYAEESIPALVAAAKQGYGIETDIRWTSDNVPVIVHDASTKPNLECSGGPYTISKTTWAVLKARCRTPAAASPDGRTYPIGTFDDLAAGLQPFAGATLFAEVKVVQTQAQVDGFLAVLRRHDLLDRAVVTSFYPAELAKMRDAATPLGTTLTLMQFVVDTKTPASTLRAAGVRYVAVASDVASKTYLSTLRTAGLTSVVYTVDTTAQWAAARSAGADLVITDVPAAYLRWLADR